MNVFVLIRSIFFVTVEVKGYEFNMKTLYVMSLQKQFFFKVLFSLDSTSRETSGLSGKRN